MPIVCTVIGKFRALFTLFKGVMLCIHCKSCDIYMCQYSMNCHDWGDFMTSFGRPRFFWYVIIYWTNFVCLRAIFSLIYWFPNFRYILVNVRWVYIPIFIYHYRVTISVAVLGHVLLDVLVKKDDGRVHMLYWKENSPLLPRLA